MIEPLGLEHVEQVADLHRAALTGLLSELGRPAALSYYAGCVETGVSVGFVDVQDGKVRGFVLGSAAPAQVKRAVIRANPAGTLGALLLGILRRPAALAWLLQSFRGPDEGSYDGAQPELTYLAVASEHRKSGVGRSLVDEFSRAMRATGASAYELSVDDGNGSAAAWYEKLGFKPIGRYREFGTVHRRYRLALAPR